MLMRYYCTYFDHNYLPRGLALYESLRRHSPTFELWVLCLSRECYDWLAQKQFPGVRLISLEEFEQADPALLAAKQNRSIVEYYFTCTPSLPRFVFDRSPQADLVTYLDADLYFFSDPESVFAEMGNRSIAIIPHRFPPALKHLEATGIYNVGWVSFRRDEPGQACLSWWRERCLEWCYDQVEPTRFGDQKYLDQWPTRFKNVAVLQHKGANLGPWNLANYRIRFEAGRVKVDECDLVFFHCHGFQQVNQWLYEPHLVGFAARPTRVIRRHILLPYWHALKRAQRQIQAGDSLAPKGLRESSKHRPEARPVFGQKLWAGIRRWHRLAMGLLKHKYVLVWPWEASPERASDPVPCAKTNSR